jgi:hypothetical protein
LSSITPRSPDAAVVLFSVILDFLP